MARKGNKRHIKALNAPKYFGVHRKESKYVAKPSPGRHSKQKSIALLVLLKKAGLVDSSSEAVRAVKTHKIAVNGKTVSNPKYAVGLNDMIAIEGLGKSYAVSISSKGQAALEEAKEGDASRKCKVVGKYVWKSNSVMLRLHDGTVLKAPDKKIKVGDTIVLDQSRKPVSHIPLGVGSKCLVIDGVHVGHSGKVVSLTKGNMHVNALATVEEEDGNKFDTIVNNIIVVG
ncbi:S4 domain-containing protein [Candidatus Marsarchaeota archaeon]|nr:S4 domain-containing protein [Candidatus Marsarchaeota archaeon]MCL5404542.1 S4 domain-containing protein [Candidatus Marsarchaeota archaeon]